MRHRTVSITDKSSNHLSYIDFDYTESNEREIERMKRVLKNAINGELTERQKYCMCEYYLHGRSMKSIADELELNPSTVTRHIQFAKRRLRRIARYY